MRVLKVLWSRALGVVCEVALSYLLIRRCYSIIQQDEEESKEGMIFLTHPHELGGPVVTCLGGSPTGTSYPFTWTWIVPYLVLNAPMWIHPGRINEGGWLIRPVHKLSWHLYSKALSATSSLEHGEEGTMITWRCGRPHPHTRHLDPGCRNGTGNLSA